MTAYAHKDDNNRFLIKKWNEEPPLMFTEDWNNAEIELVKHGDLIRLEHIMTRRNIHSHQQPAPLAKKQFQVTGYGEVNYCINYREKLVKSDCLTERNRRR